MNFWQQQLAPKCLGGGVIIACTAHLGKVLRDDYSWKHIDEMNHVFELLGKGGPAPVSFYVTQANRLKLLGR